MAEPGFGSKRNDRGKPQVSVVSTYQGSILDHFGYLFFEPQPERGGVGVEAIITMQSNRSLCFD